MDVVTSSSGPVVPHTAPADVVRGVAESLVGPDATIPIVVGAAGFGKSAVLRSAVRRAARSLTARVVTVSGRAVASGAHLDLIVAAQLDRVGAETATPASFWVALSDATETGPVILAIDDVDALLYKRASLQDMLVRLLSDSTVAVACTVGADTSDRLVGPRGALRTRTERPMNLFLLEPLDDAAATELALRRNAHLGHDTTRAIVDASGGHPAAVAFLARFAAACPECVTNTGELRHVAEFAGSVFAGPWASLGPQQRAILRALADVPVAQSAAQIAQRLALSASHVSAQLTRLRAEALITQPTRSQFVLPPLLAAWLRFGPASSVARADAPPATPHARSR